MKRRLYNASIAFVMSVGVAGMLPTAMAGLCNSGSHCHQKRCGTSKCNCCLDMLDTVIWSLCCETFDPCGTGGCSGVLTNGSPSTMPTP